MLSFASKSRCFCFSGIQWNARMSMRCKRNSENEVCRASEKSRGRLFKRRVPESKIHFELFLLSDYVHVFASRISNSWGGSHSVCFLCDMTYIVLYTLHVAHTHSLLYRVVYAFRLRFFPPRSHALFSLRVCSIESSDLDEQWTTTGSIDFHLFELLLFSRNLRTAKRNDSTHIWNIFGVQKNTHTHLGDLASVPNK